MSKKLNGVFEDWKKIKDEVTSMAKKRNVKMNEVQNLMNKVLKQAEGDIKGLVDHDVKKVMTRLKSERKALEKMVDDVLQTEVKKAKSFINTYKKQLSGLQKSVETTLKKKVGGKKAKKKATKKKSTGARKKSTKKTVETTATNVSES